jgi:hypothetical protein
MLGGADSAIRRLINGRCLDHKRKPKQHCYRR